MLLGLGLGLSHMRTHAKSYVGPLDALASQIYAAFGLSRLIAAYSGPLIRVRRSSDNAQQDIGGDGIGRLNTATLLAFVGAGSGYVVTLYDQTGNGRHATQTTAAAQPRIVNAGVLDVGPNGRPVMMFDGSDDVLSVSNALGFGRNASALTVAAIANPTNRASVADLFYCPVGGAASSRMLVSVGSPNASVQGRRLDADSLASISAAAPTGWLRTIGRLRYSAGQADIALNGTVTTGAFQTAGNSQDVDGSGAPATGRPGPSNPLAGPYSTLVLARGALDIPTLDAALAKVMP